MGLIKRCRLSFCSFFELYSLRAAKSQGFRHFVLCCAYAQRSRSNRRAARLCKHRLARACLSAPFGAEVQSLASINKNGYPDGYPNLNLTPSAVQALGAWCFALHSSATSHRREQAARGSLVRAQTRSRLLICAFRRRGSKLCFDKQKRIPRWVSVFVCEGAIKKIFSPFFVWV